MLNLMRRKDERILIGNDIEIVITKIVGGQVHLGISAPREINIVRKEIDTKDRTKEEL